MSLTTLVLLMVGCACDAPQTSGDSPERLSMEAASAKVAASIRREKPQAQIKKTFALVDLTTPDAWDQLHVQVVKVKDGNVEQGETFVLVGDKIERIGRAFGGEGVTSLIVADLAGDKRPLLIYSFAWGSGMHRSEIGILDFHGKQPKELLLTPINLSTVDYALRGANTGEVEVLMGTTLIGHVTAVRKDNVLNAAITLAEKLPEDVRRHLK